MVTRVNQMVEQITYVYQKDKDGVLSIALCEILVGIIVRHAPNLPEAENGLALLMAGMHNSVTAKFADRREELNDEPLIH